MAVNRDEWSERNNSNLERHRKATEDELGKLKYERQNKALILVRITKGIEIRLLFLD